MKRLPENAYGLLLVIDGYEAPQDKCGDEDLLFEILKQMPKEIGMRPLGTPHVVKVDETGIKGLSGFTFIMESHISIHTYEERGFVTADIYSCKWFDTETALNLLINAFDLKEFEHSQIVRGRQYNSYSLSNSS